MTPTQSPEPAIPSQDMTDEQLLDELKETVEKLVSDHVDEDAQSEKTIQYIRLDKADKYVRGLQYVAPSISRDNGSFDWVPVGPPNAGSFDTGSLTDYNLDVMKTYGRKFTATLGQRPFYNVEAVANNPNDENDRRAAREANKAVLLLRSWWDVKTKNLELAWHAWKSGTTFGYTRYVADGNRYGYAEEPIVEPRSVTLEPAGYRCPNCGAKSPELDTREIPVEDGGYVPQTVCPACSRPLNQTAFEPAQTTEIPVDTGRTEKYPNGRVELEILTGFFVTVPFYAKSLEDTPWLYWEAEENGAKLMSIYPRLRAQYEDAGSISAGNGGMSAASSTGKTVRAAAVSQTGVARQQTNDRVTVRRIWIRPYIYEYVKDKGQRETLKRYYPDGLKVVRVEGKAVGLANENLYHYFSEMQPEVGDYIFRDGISWGIIPAQDFVNDTANQLAEIVERSNTVTLIDPELIDVDEWNNKRTLPMEFMAVKPGAGTSMDAGIKTIQAPKWPDGAEKLIDMVHTFVQSHTGVLPNIYGGGAPTQTAEQHRNELNQALMQLGTTGEFMIRFWVRAHENGVRELARNAPKAMNAPAQNGGSMPGTQVEPIDFDVILNGNWHVEGEIGIPRSFAERKDALVALINPKDGNPQLASMLGVDSPENLGIVRDYLDLPEMAVPGDDEREYIHGVIEELLKGQPIEQPSMDGIAPPQAMPSVPFRAEILNPQSAVAIIRAWAVSGAGRALENTPGYQNVMAYLQQANTAANPPMPPPMPGDGSEGGGKPPAAPAPGQIMGGPPSKKEPPQGTELPPGAPMQPQGPPQ